MVRDIIPFIFWPWLFVSCGILLHRRIGSGSWRPGGGLEDQSAPELREVEAPRPSWSAAAETSPSPETAPGSDRSTTPWFPPAPDVSTPVDVTAETPPVAPTGVDLASLRPSPRTLAEALEGITMPCDLAPLMGTGRFDPRKVTFFTRDTDPATVGGALSDELERLGYELTPEDDRSIRGRRDDDTIRARLLSAGLHSEVVMRELHPSAPEGAVVVEFELI